METKNVRGQVTSRKRDGGGVVCEKRVFTVTRVTCSRFQNCGLFWTQVFDDLDSIPGLFRCVCTNRVTNGVSLARCFRLRR